MILGCDIGTGYTKVVVMEGENLLFSTKVLTEAYPDRALEKALSEVRKTYGDKIDETSELVITGWGESKVSRAHRGEPMIKCLGKAGVWAEPSCKTLLCLGTQQTYALNLDNSGKVLQYRTNDKCASGAGKFLDVICEALECGVQETAGIAAKSDQHLQITSQCAVFAESEVVCLVNDGQSVPNIVDSILRALTQNIITLVKRIKKDEILLIAGGMANNDRIVHLLKEAVPIRMQVFGSQPDYVGAIGAALCASGGVA